ncbi:MAG TPA: PKD domain-containing protein [Candidatus Limnocylindrales bacterium]|nr:PKD domain-containing protein [Candidatus Limnocylindrales bacterium]
MSWFWTGKDARRGARRLVAVAAVAAMLPLAAALPVAAAGEPVATDAFSRTVSGGWGVADTGGSYTLEGNAANFSVSGGIGRIVLPNGGANRAVRLTGATAHDMQLTVRVATDRQPNGGPLYVYLPARRTGTSEYRPKLILNANGTVSAHAGIVINGSESSLAPAVVVPGLNQSAGSFVWVKALVSGASPTTVSVKAWADGASEPGGWNFSTTNSNAALQGTGSVGLRAYVQGSSTNTPITVQFDDLLVESLDAPPPPVAAFDWSQQAGTFSVEFDDASSGAPTEWAWDFGDGAISTDQNPTHTYAAEGSYEVTLVVSSPNGTDSFSDEIDVGPLDPGDVVLAADAFSRTRSSSWGVADAGSLYSYQGVLADFNVNGDSATLRLPNSGATRSAFLNSVLTDEVALEVTVSADKRPQGGPLFVYASLRRQLDGSAYRPKLRIAADGAVFAHVGRQSPSGESSLGTEQRVPGLVLSPDVPIHLRAEASGRAPTTVRIRAWAEGAAEPSVWHFSATDSTAALQSAGTVGVISHLQSSANNAPLVVRFDDLAVTSSDPVDRVEGETLIGAGDISLCSNNNDEATAVLLDQVPGAVFTAGDNAQAQATVDEFANCFDPTWGRHKARIRPSIGNHEYHTTGAVPYFNYFGAAAGTAGKGWYAYDVGAWRIYVMNSNCGNVGCTPGSEQEQWLRADLAANPRECALAMWHHPRYSSGSEHGSTMSVQPFWQALYEAGAEMVISGHDHDYERFAPRDASGAVNNATGIRQFVVGTGGASLRPSFSNISPASEVRQATNFGVFKLVLGDGEFEWEFIPIAGQAFTDRGSGSCH